MVHSDSDCSSSTDESQYENNPLDEYGRPLNRPQFRPVGVSSVLTRAKEFLPLFRDATMQLIEPDVIKNDQIADVRLPTLTEQDRISDESDSDTSFGVEIDVGLGVYDVSGDIDYLNLERAGIPILDAPSADKPQTTVSVDLIQEIKTTP